MDMHSQPGTPPGAPPLGTQGAAAHGDRAQRDIGAVSNFLMQSLPPLAVAHSFHVDALMDPRIGRDRALQGFSLVELNELHHMIAAVGALARLDQGDRTALRSLGRNLAGFLANRQEAMRLVRSLPAEVQRHPAMAQALHLTMQHQQMVESHMDLLDRVIRAARAENPGPLLVRG